MENLGDFLLNQRKELKLSLRNAANLIGISHSYLNILEKGLDPRNNVPVKPTPETLKLISNAYNVPYEYLMRLSGYISDKLVSDKDNVTNRSKEQEIINKLTQFFSLENIDIKEPDIDERVQRYQGVMSFKENYLNLKEKYNEDILQLYVRSILKSYINDNEITHSKKMDMIKGLLKDIAESDL